MTHEDLYYDNIGQVWTQSDQDILFDFFDRVWTQMETDQDILYAFFDLMGLRNLKQYVCYDGKLVKLEDVEDPSSRNLPDLNVFELKIQTRIWEKK